MIHLSPVLRWLITFRGLDGLARSCFVYGSTQAEAEREIRSRGDCRQILSTRRA